MRPREGCVVLNQEFNSMYKFLIVFLLPLGTFAQDGYYKTDSNNAGKVGLLRGYLDIERRDTVIPHNYHDIWQSGDYFVLIESAFTEHRDGEPYGTYYKGSVVNEAFEEIRRFDTIKQLPSFQNSRDCSFKFKEGGKEGFFSGYFKGNPWTGLYDEIDVTRRGDNEVLEAEIQVPGHRFNRCGIIGRNGDGYTLIGPLGDTIVEFSKEHRIAIWSMRFFELIDLKNETSSLYSLNGTLMESGITSEIYSLGPGSTIHVFSHLDGTQSLWTGIGQRTAPIPYELNVNTLDADPYIVGKNDKGEYYTLTWKGEVISGPYEGYLKLFDTDNAAIRQNGKWQLTGEDVSSFHHLVFDSVATLTHEKYLRNYAFYAKGETVLISIGNGSGNTFWSAQVEGNTIQVIDNFMVAKNNGLWARLSEHGMSEYQFDEFEALWNTQQFMKARIHGKAVLVDHYGVVFFQELNLQDIEAHSCELGIMYELTGNKVVGYFLHGMDPQQVELIYDDMECGDYGFCAKKGRKWGWLDSEGNVKLDFTHTLKEVEVYDPNEGE